MLPHWDRNCISNFLARAVTVYWPCNARAWQASHWNTIFQFTSVSRPGKRPAALAGIELRPDGLEGDALPLGQRGRGHRQTMRREEMDVEDDDFEEDVVGIQQLSGYKLGGHSMECWQTAACAPPRWPSGWESASRAEDLGLLPAFAVHLFPGRVIPVTSNGYSRGYHAGRRGL